MPIASERLTRNNFDLLRLVLAGMVAVVHLASLSEEPALAWVPTVVSSDLAVKAFFVVSGFLIVMSLERSATGRIYAAKRLRRIYPAYAIVIVLAAVLLPLTASEGATYFTVAWWRYLLANLVFLNFVQLTLPGVFAENPVPFVNGALWTLKIEVGFYALVPAIVWLCHRCGWGQVLTAFYLASVVYVPAVETLADRGLVSDAWAHQLPGQLSYFLAGAALYRFFPAFEARVAGVTAAALVALVADQWWPLPWLEPAALAVCIIAAGTAVYVGPFGRFGDFSYGLYILHFPIIQVVVASGIARGRPLILVMLAIGTALAGAVMLWHGVEKRWLMPSSHYRRSST